MSTAQDLADIEKVIEDSSIAAILLGGLTAKYDPLVMAIENSNIEVFSDIVKNILLHEFSQDIERVQEDTAMPSRFHTKPKPKPKKELYATRVENQGIRVPLVPIRRIRIRFTVILRLQLPVFLRLI